MAQNIFSNISELLELLKDNSHTNFSNKGVGTILIYKNSESMNKENEYNDIGFSIGSKLEISNFSGSLASEKIALWSAITEGINPDNFLFSTTTGNLNTAKPLYEEFKLDTVFKYDNKQELIDNLSTIDVEILNNMIVDKINEIKQNKAISNSNDYIVEKDLKEAYEASNSTQQLAYSPYSKYNVGGQQYKQKMVKYLQVVM